MAGLRLARWLATGLLALLTGCTTPPPASDRPLAPPAPLTTPSASAADVPAPVVKAPSRLADFIARRIRRNAGTPETSPADTEVQAAPAPEPEPDVDEKYRFTGEGARELERGHASWYGTKFHGRLTASGEPYDKYALTAAHKTLPFGTIVRVRSLELGTEVDVRINDRGPFSPGRVIDVSQAAAEALGLKHAGVGTVSIKVARSTLNRLKSLAAGKQERGVSHRRLHRSTGKHR